MLLHHQDICPLFNLAIATSKPGSQVADFQCAVVSTVSFNTQTDGSAYLKGGETLTIKSGLFESIGLPGAIFSRRAAGLPATRLIRSNGE